MSLKLCPRTGRKGKQCLCSRPKRAQSRHLGGEVPSPRGWSRRRWRAAAPCLLREPDPSADGHPASTVQDLGPGGLFRGSYGVDHMFLDTAICDFEPEVVDNFQQFVTGKLLNNGTFLDPRTPSHDATRT